MKQFKLELWNSSSKIFLNSEIWTVEPSGYIFKHEKNKHFYVQRIKSMVEMKSHP